MCWNCLGPSLVAFKCNDKTRCSKWKGKHHVLIHDNRSLGSKVKSVTEAEGSAVSVAGIKAYGCQCQNLSIVFLFGLLSQKFQERNQPG